MTERILNNRYSLEARVGEGGMAVTYRARDLVLKRTVAVKMLREQFTADPQFVERFRREAQAAAQLTHDNIAGVYDTGVAEGAYYIVMEFVEGTDLKARLRRDGLFGILATLEIGMQIAAGLEEAHRHGLVHRDIKPHNILLTSTGKVKVTDFGIAKAISEGEDTGVIVGSVHYLSPEQARGEATTPRSDLYSLGAVLYEMLTGRTVFEGENAIAVAHKQIYERPLHPRVLRPEIPTGLEALILRCLEKEPRARYQSAAEVKTSLAHLHAMLAQEATVVLSPPPPGMEATAVYRTAAVSAPGTPEPPLAAPPPRTPPRPPVEAAPRGGGGAWGIVILFLLLASAVGYGIWLMVEREPPAPPSPTGEQGVPDLLGLTEVQALDLLKRRGFTGQPAKETSDDYPVGQVCRQDPSPEETLAPETPVLLWVSDGPSHFAIPDVAQMSLNRAKQVLRENGLSKEFGKFLVTSEDADLPKAQVIRTDPPANTVVKRDATITLVLSTGVKPVLPPIEGEMVTETYLPGAAPDVGSETVYVRIELENPVGSEPEPIVDRVMTPGEEITPQPFDRLVDKRAVVRMFVGKDQESLGERPYAEESFGPRTPTRSATTPAPTAPRAPRAPTTPSRPPAPGE
jgi:tRNA A-37 threonylcarbamoyl transferase component Bud32